MKLKELREKTKKSVIEIQKLLGISNPAYYNYENGKAEPNIDKLIKLADYYNVSIDYLVGRVFQDDLGYISPDQRVAIKKLLNLTEDNLVRAGIYITALLDGQNEKVR